LFKFDRSDINDVLPGGRAELDQLVEKLNYYARIDAIELIGHTDRPGSQAYNQQLSKVRADTIMHYLRSRGATDSRVGPPISPVLRSSNAMQSWPSSV